jgi:4-hydroxy-3-methylbut-2-enyl diphosphate reductase
MGSLVWCSMEILAPTFLEYWAVRCALPRARASWTGVGLTRWQGARQGSAVIVCGLAGALAPGLPPGTIVIPDQVGLADGRSMQCDPVLVQALLAAARTFQVQVHRGPLLTTRSLVVGTDRQTWFQRGFVAADMETGLLMEQGLRVATIRAILDGPEHGLSPDWLRPGRALRQPRLWRELLWLGRNSPRYALRAAYILKAGLNAFEKDA